MKKTKCLPSSEAPPAKKSKILTSDSLPFHLFSEVRGEKKQNKNNEFFTIQTGLRPIMRDDFRENLIDLIEDDVLTVSTVMTEFSLYFNFLCREKLGNHVRDVFVPQDVADFFSHMDTTTLRNVMFSVQGKTGRTYQPLSPRYAELRQQYGLEAKYNCTYRTGKFPFAIN